MTDDTTPYMRQSLMGVPNGVAILDGGGNVPLDELGNVPGGAATWVDISGSLLNGWVATGEVKYKVQGSVVYVAANLDGSSATSAVWTTLDAPVSIVYPGLALGTSLTGPVPCTHSIDTSGNVSTIVVDIAGDIPQTVNTAFSYVVD